MVKILQIHDFDVVFPKYVIFFIINKNYQYYKNHQELKSFTFDNSGKL